LVGLIALACATSVSMLQTAIIARETPATPRSMLVRLTLDGEFRFLAGQAALVGTHGQPIRRPYSIAVGPDEAARDRSLEFLIGFGPDGGAWPHLPDLSPGTRVDIEGPLGSFVFPESPGDTDFLFVAGGTGIAPLRAMWHQALAGDPSWRIGVVYSARTPDEFAFDDELSALSAVGRLTYVRTATRHSGGSWDGGSGRIDRARLEAAIVSAQTLCFVCGPEPLVHDVPGMLREIGISPERIRVEEWAVRAP
jgi:ferredoxin-NADP reductase